jgi:hypothetical protein
VELIDPDNEDEETDNDSAPRKQPVIIRTSSNRVNFIGEE